MEKEKELDEDKVEGVEDTKVDETKEDTKKEEHKQPTKDEKAEINVEDLKKALVEANEKVKEVETLTATVTDLQTKNAGQDKAIKEYEELLSNLINTKMEQVPPEYKDLIPENMDLKQKLNWLDKAESKGIFNKEKKSNPDVEIGKPMNMETDTVDTSKLSGSQLLKMAYHTLKK